jgi:hypothetical protein
MVNSFAKRRNLIWNTMQAIRGYAVCVLQSNVWRR